MVVWMVACGAVGPVDDPGVEPVPTDGDAGWTLTVSSSSGEALPGLRVELFDGATTRSLTTNAAGRAHVPELAAGSYGVEVAGPWVVGFTFAVGKGEELEHDVRLPPPGSPVVLPADGGPVDIGDGLLVEVVPADLEAPPFAAPTDTLAAVRVDLPFDGPGTVIGGWLIAPHGHVAEGGIPVSFDVDEVGPLDVWQVDLGAASWLRVGTVHGSAQAILEGDAELSSTVPVMLVRP